MTTKKRIRHRPVKLTPRDRRIIASLTDESWKEGCETPRQLYLKAVDVRGVGRLSRWMQTRVVPLTVEDWKRIVLLCTDAIVKKRYSHRSDRACVDILVPFNYRKMCPSFPKGILVDVPNVLTLKFRVNANKLLDYVYEKGYSSYNSRQLKKQLGIVNHYFTSLTNLLECDEIDEWDKILLQHGSDGEVEAYLGRLLSSDEEGEENE